MIKLIRQRCWRMSRHSLSVSWHLGHAEGGVQELTRLLEVAISALRMSGSYLEDEDDLELTAGETRRRLEAEPTRDFQ